MDKLASRFKMRQGNQWGTGIIVMNPQKQFLAGKRTDTHNWCTPGGRVKVGETPIQAIIRETKEESNLKVNPEFLDVMVGPVRDRIWCSFLFIAKNVTGDVAPQLSEISEWKWVSLEELKAMDLFEPSRALIEYAEANGVI